jgi:hypothetical protein
MPLKAQHTVPASIVMSYVDYIHRNSLFNHSDTSADLRKYLLMGSATFSLPAFDRRKMPLGYIIDAHSTVSVRLPDGVA